MTVNSATGIANLNDYFARQKKFLDEAMTDIFMTTFDSM